MLVYLGNGQEVWQEAWRVDLPIEESPVGPEHGGGQILWAEECWYKLSDTDENCSEGK